MKRSYSQTHISNNTSFSQTAPRGNVELCGSLVKKVVDNNSAVWEGMSLKNWNSDLNNKKSEMR